MVISNLPKLTPADRLALDDPEAVEQIDKALRAGVQSIYDPYQERERCEDCIAASWQKLCEASERGRLSHLVGLERLAGYAYRIGRNAALDDLRRLRVNRRVEAELQADAELEQQRLLRAPAADRYEGADPHELAELRSAMRHLPDTQQKAIALQLEGLTCPQIALMLGTAIGTVKTWIHRGKQRLRVQLVAG